MMLWMCSFISYKWHLIFCQISRSYQSYIQNSALAIRNLDFAWNSDNNRHSTVYSRVRLDVRNSRLEGIGDLKTTQKERECERERERKRKCAATQGFWNVASVYQGFSLHCLQRQVAATLTLTYKVWAKWLMRHNKVHFSVTLKDL